MTASLSRAKLCEVVKGHALENTPELNPQKEVFHGVEFDSREVKGGELFVALPGAAAHGHSFVAQAFSRGAAFALIESEEPFKDFPEKERLVLVPDALKAFSELASWWRNELNTPLIGVTGSVGKTTVKELIAHLLMEQGAGAYSRKSHNNHVGVPYTLCQIKREHSWAVAEIGMNHPGEISSLTRLACPDVAVITTIAPAHIEFFPDISGIARAKLEIIEGLRPQGVLITNADSEVLEKELKAITLKPSQRNMRFGSNPRCEVSYSDVKGRGLEGIEFTLTCTLSGREATCPVQMSMLGAQNASNAAAAVLAAMTLKPSLTLSELSKRLKSFVAPIMRMNVYEMSGERKIIDDSYNANPLSMKSFIELADNLASQKLRVGLVVGDMKELGKDSSRYHQELGEAISRLKIQFVIAVGEYSKELLEASSKVGRQVMVSPTPKDAAQLVAAQSFDVVLIKASRGVGLDATVRELLATHGAGN